MEQEINTHDTLEAPKVFDPSNLPPTPDEKPRNLLRLIAVFVLAPIIIATSLYIFWKNFNKLNEPNIPIVDEPKTNPVPSSSAPVVIDKTSDFKEVINTGLNFAIKIPPAWTISDMVSDETPLARYMAPDNSSFEVFTVDTVSSTLEDYLIELDEANKTGWEGTASKEVLEVKPAKVDNHDAIIRKERWLAADFTTVVTYVKINDKVYTLTVIPTPEVIFESQEAAKNYDLILSTFRVL